MISRQTMRFERRAVMDRQNKPVSETVSDAVTNVIRDTGKMGVSLIEALSEVMERAIQETQDAGGDLEETANGIVLGILRAGKEAGAGTVDVLGTIAGMVIQHVAHAKGDLASAAKGLVSGSVEGARELGLNLEAASLKAATGAVRTAYEINSGAGDKVFNAVTGTISGEGFPPGIRRMKKRKELFMTSKIHQFWKKPATLFIALMVMGSLMAGCARESSSYKKNTSQNVNGQTVVVEKEETKTTETHEHTGVVGSVFHVVGEILAFPFEVIAGVFRFIF